MVQVCAMLSAMEDTERDFTITLATSDGTGILASYPVSQGAHAYII